MLPANGIAAVAPGGGDGQIQFRLVVGMDSVERLTLLDPIADLAEQLDAGALVDRGARGSRQPIQLQAIDLGNDAVAIGAGSFLKAAPLSSSWRARAYPAPPRS